MALPDSSSLAVLAKDGLRTLLARDRAMETWLREHVVPAAQALKAAPESALSADQVREHLAKKRRSRTTTAKA